MAYSATFCTESEVDAKAGAEASSDVTADQKSDFVKQAESFINSMTRENWTDKYSNLNEDVKAILSEAASNLAAMYVINYDMSGFTNRLEAQTMLDILRDGAFRCISLLRNKTTQKYVEDA